MRWGGGVAENSWGKKTPPVVFTAEASAGEGADTTTAVEVPPASGGEEGAPEEGVGSGAEADTGAGAEPAAAESGELLRENPEIATLGARYVGALGGDAQELNPLAASLTFARAIHVHSAENLSVSFNSSEAGTAVAQPQKEGQNVGAPISFSIISGWKDYPLGMLSEYAEVDAVVLQVGAGEGADFVASYETTLAVSPWSYIPVTISDIVVTRVSENEIELSFTSSAVSSGGDTVISCSFPRDLGDEGSHSVSVGPITAGSNTYIVSPYTTLAPAAVAESTYCNLSLFYHGRTYGTETGIAGDQNEYPVTDLATHTIPAWDATQMAKDITSFSFADLSPLWPSVIIQGNTINAFVPSSYNLKGIAPAITISEGATIEPALGTPLDFEFDEITGEQSTFEHVTYTVTARDGSKRTYEVHISPCFNISNVSCERTGPTEATIRFTSDVAGVFSFFQDNVQMLITTDNQFEMAQGDNTYVYTWEPAEGLPTAEQSQSMPIDIVFLEYTYYPGMDEPGLGGSAYRGDLTIPAWNPPAPAEAKITSFTLDGVAGMINGTNIYVALPAEADASSLTPVVECSEGASVTPTTAQDFSDPSSLVEYVVAASNGDAATYRVHVTQPIAESSIDNFGTLAQPEAVAATIEGVDLAKDASNFEGLYLKVNNEMSPVARENYTLAKGSIVITLKEDYVASLGAGTFEFAAVFNAADTGEQKVALTELIVTPQATDDADEDGYHDGDVAVINTIIAGSSLDWTPDDPASWPVNNNILGEAYIAWNSETPKRVTYLMLKSTGLSSLDVSALAELKSLECSANALTSLEVAGLENLYSLYCAGNQLTTLDVSGMTSLVTLDCSDNNMPASPIGAGVSGLADAIFRQAWTGGLLSGIRYLPQPGSSQTASVVISAEQSVSGPAQPVGIDTYVHDALNTIPSGGVVTVTGSKTDVDTFMVLDIPTGTKLIWQAEYVGASELGGVEGFFFTYPRSGSGSFEVATGGLIANASGYAISLANNAISVTGGTVASNATGAIVGNSVTVSGGFVFGVGSAIERTEGVSGVVSANSFSLNPNSSDNGVVVAWNKEAGNTAYTAGTATDLVVAPAEATAVWATNSEGAAGISYSYNGNTGFYAIDGLTVNEPLSSDATLSMLNIYKSGALGSENLIPLSPAFAAEVFSYTATVPYSVTTAYVTALPSSSKPGVGIEGGDQPISLNVGSNTITLTVTAEDGSEQDYVITITREAGSSTKDITFFTIGSASGTISGTNISLTVPFGTDVTALAPTITHTGIDLSPASGVAQDFTAPVTYTVKAEDGSTKDYTVTVSVTPPKTTNSITSFKLAGETGLFLGSAIYVTVPAGTDLTNLEPVITHNGVSINPTGSRDFSASVTYAVTAEDGSSKTYRVYVSVVANPEDPEHVNKPAIDASDFGSSDATGTVTSVVTEDLVLDEEGNPTNFDGLYLVENGVLTLVDPSNYTLERGSTKITLLESYLKTLGSGSYTFAAIYINGLMATIDLQVALPAVDNPSAGSTGSAAGTGTGTGSTLPATGDSPVVLMAVIIVLLAGLGLTTFALLRRRAVK